MSKYSVDCQECHFYDWRGGYCHKRKEPVTVAWCPEFIGVWMRDYPEDLEKLLAK